MPPRKRSRAGGAPAASTTRAEVKLAGGDAMPDAQVSMWRDGTFADVDPALVDCVDMVYGAGFARAGLRGTWTT